MEVENIFEYYLNIAGNARTILNNESTLPNKKELQLPLEKLKRVYNSLFENEGLIISYIQYMSDRINDPVQQPQALFELEAIRQVSYKEKKQDDVEAIMPEVKILMNRLQNTEENALKREGSPEYIAYFMLENQKHSKMIGEINMFINDAVPEEFLAKSHNLPAPPTLEFLDKTFNEIYSNMTKVIIIAGDKNIPEVVKDEPVSFHSRIGKLRETHYTRVNTNGFKNDN